ncbi:ciliogenesis-associated TTC17-interacting protein isoform X5 [Phasianus colchicus]|uniref:ciliogenesis-associated TTC17-interacting protein isoform X5 n=1 Tax=Phasianus colchicus TaxID=9054 RepID=UPI00129E2356|nr:ciliogenesis-associated TTC17-interacting protein isoform X5 [Phasianus colchicus]
MQAAAKFLNRIGPEELERCLFAETLALVATGGQPQGHLWVRARHAPYEQEGQRVRSCLLLQAGSQGLLDGVPYSCSLTGYVSMQLETLEQEQHERLEFGAHPMERKIHMVQHPHGMTVTVTTREGERSLGMRQQPVGSAQGEVLVVERALHTAESIPMVWHYSLLPSGHLARRVQVGCPVVAVLQDAPALSGMGAEPQPLFPKQLLDWEEDAQLCSWFLDRKEELRASHSTYIQQHPELFALLADFLQALLLRQPPDPILFAAEFFAPFARHQPPGPSFASSISPSPFCSISCPNPLAQGD